MTDPRAHNLSSWSHPVVLATVLERDQHVAEWIRLTEEKDLSQVGTKSGAVGRPEGGIRAAARELGIAKNDAHRAVKVASLSDAAKTAIKQSPGTGRPPPRRGEGT